MWRKFYFWSSLFALHSSCGGECRSPIKKTTITATKASQQQQQETDINISSRQDEEWANKCVKYQRLIRINVNKIFRFDCRRSDFIERTNIKATVIDRYDAYAEKER